jgi:tRNA (guanine-N7-)-methyltransferase
VAVYKFIDADELPPVLRDPAAPASPSTPTGQKRQIEREFGVPVPGEIQPVPIWTDTALKTMPEQKPLDFKALFGRDAPVMLDIGCGNGRSTLASAVWRPQFDHLSSDVLPVVIRYATRRANQRALTNAKFAVIGGRELLLNYIAPQSVAEIHVYHPQPYYDAKLIHKRLITPEFISLVHRSLAPGGLFVIQTDNPGYWKYMQKIVPLFFQFEEHPDKWPDAPKGRTRREIIALREGLPVFRGTGRPRTDITPDDAIKLAASLPAPKFDADRKLMALDQMERESAGGKPSGSRPKRSGSSRPADPNSKSKKQDKK